MISRAINVSTPFFSRKINLAYMDIDMGNGETLLMRALDQQSEYVKYKEKFRYCKENDDKYLFISIYFNKKYLDIIDKAIKKANDNAILLGYTNIDKYYDKFYNKN